VIWFDYVFVLMLDIKYYYQQAGFIYNRFVHRTDLSLENSFIVYKTKIEKNTRLDMIWFMMLSPLKNNI